MTCPKKPLPEAIIRSDSASIVSEAGRIIAATVLPEVAVLPTDKEGNLQLAGPQARADVQPVSAPADSQAYASNTDVLELLGKQMSGVKVDPRPTRLTMLLNALTYAGGGSAAGIFLFWLGHSPKGEAFVALVDRILETAFGN
jgi:hypothetical protein